MCSGRSDSGGREGTEKAESSDGALQLFHNGAHLTKAQHLAFDDASETVTDLALVCRRDRGSFRALSLE